MNKRSAMLIAAGLIFTMIMGGMALSLGMTGLTSSAAASAKVHHRKHLKPLVKTTKRTVKVHRESPTPAPVVVSAPSSPSAGATTYSSTATTSYGSGGSSTEDHSSYDSSEGHGGGSDEGSGGGDD